MSEPASPPRRKPRFRERNAALRVVPSTPSPVAEIAEAPPPPAPPPPQPIARSVAIPRVTVEQALYAAILLAGFGLRIWDVGSRAMHGDESVHAWLAWNLFRGAGYAYDPVYHGPFQFPITAVFFFLFGVSEVTARLLSVLFGTAIIGLPWFFRREMGRPAALLASFFIAISPVYTYVARLERDDSITAFFAAALAVAIWGYVRTRQVRYVYLGAASAALSLAAMENTYITYFVLGSFVLLVLGSEWLARTSVGSVLLDLWRRTGELGRISGVVEGGFLVILLAAYLLTIFTGLYLPVPLVLALFLIGLVSRQAMLGTAGEERSWLGALRSISGHTWLNAATIIVALLFLFFSTFGSNLHGIWDAGKPFLNSGNACAGNNFPLNPCRKDIVGGLFYWLSQDKVARGGQPWFYYPLLYGLYEQIAVIFGIGGMLWFLRRPTLFTTFLTYWALLMFGVYSWAGEKFPWLTIHPLFPFMLLGAMFIVDVTRRAWGWRWVVLAGILVVLGLEVHNMYEVNFVNGANPIEMMVYVQSSPQTPVVAHKILALSNKVTNGDDMAVTIDSLDTWPFAWYLRDMPNAAYPSSAQLLQKPYATNPVIIVDQSDQAGLLPKLGNRYTGHEYILRWWFPENYKQLTWSSFFRKAVSPGTWSVIADWQIERRPFGPRQSVNFYLYVKRGIASPY